MSDFTPSDIIVLVSIVSSATIAILVSVFAIRAQAKAERSKSADDYARKKFDELKDIHKRILDDWAKLDIMRCRPRIGKATRLSEKR